MWAGEIVQSTCIQNSPLVPLSMKKEAKEEGVIMKRGREVGIQDISYRYIHSLINKLIPLYFYCGLIYHFKPYTGGLWTPIAHADFIQALIHSHQACRKVTGKIGPPGAQVYALFLYFRSPFPLKLSFLFWSTIWHYTQFTQHYGHMGYLFFFSHIYEKSNAALMLLTPCSGPCVLFSLCPIFYQALWVLLCLFHSNLKTTALKQKHLPWQHNALGGLRR